MAEHTLPSKINTRGGLKGGLEFGRKGWSVLYNRLNQMKAKNLEIGKYADGQGLWLIKPSKISGKWILRLSVGGKRREMGLGRWPDVSIAEARERSAQARRTLRDGTDPIVERQKERYLPAPVTVQQAIESCFEARKNDLKGQGKAGRWMSPLEQHILPKLGKLPIIDIDQHRLKRVLEPIWHDKPVTAARTLSRFSLVLKHAIAMGLNVDLLATAKAKALLGAQRHKVAHVPSLPYQEVSAFYAWLKTKGGSSPLALQFLILTAARTSEVRLATFDEIEDGIWCLAAERTKTGKEHRIPLTKEAADIVEDARSQTNGSYLFATQSGKPLSDMAMAMAMRKAGYSARPHGFRATFRTWVEEQTNTPFEVKESALGHLVDAGVVGAYQRSDRLEKRRRLMTRWQNFIIG